MVSVFVLVVFFFLFFTKTIAPVCDFEGQDEFPRDHWDDSQNWRDSWDNDRPDYKTYNCVWKSWNSWSGCSGVAGSQSRMRMNHDDVNNCQCDTEYQTRSCLETREPVCDYVREAELRRDPWDDSQDWRDSGDTGWPDYKPHDFDCEWESWDSWNGCSGGSQTRTRIKFDVPNLCRCDIEFQTRACPLSGEKTNIQLLP